MIYKNIELHGITALEEANGGFALRRHPAEIRAEFCEGGQRSALSLCGAELRFVPQGEVKITLSTVTEGTVNRATLFYGDTAAGWQTCDVHITHTPTTFTFAPSERLEFLEKVAATGKPRFAPTVLRLVLEHCAVVIHDVGGNVRPPKADEVPAKTGLFYGSSITHGSLTYAPELYWCRRVAEGLGCDHINLGLAGFCRFEKSTVDWLAARRDWDFMVAELGINVLDVYTPDQYRERVRYLIETIHAAHPDKYLFCIDVFLFRGDVVGEQEAPAFRAVLKEEAERIHSEKVVYLSGLALLTDPAGLSEDGIHPNMKGIHLIAENLQSKLAPYLL